MPPFRLTCPDCNAKLKVRKSCDQSAIRCPKCKRTIDITSIMLAQAASDSVATNANDIEAMDEEEKEPGIIWRDFVSRDFLIANYPLVIASLAGVAFVVFGSGIVAIRADLTGLGVALIVIALFVGAGCVQHIIVNNPENPAADGREAKEETDADAPPPYLDIYAALQELPVEKACDKIQLGPSRWEKVGSGTRVNGTRLAWLIHQERCRDDCLFSSLKREGRAIFEMRRLRPVYAWERAREATEQIIVYRTGQDTFEAWIFGSKEHAGSQSWDASYVRQFTAEKAKEKGEPSQSKSTLEDSIARHFEERHKRRR